MVALAVRDKTPSAMLATHAHPSRSERYQFVDTTAIVDRLRSRGWIPREERQARTNKSENAGFQRHVIRFINPSFGIRNKLPGAAETWPEILLLNSHDGTAACQIRCGLFEIVCENGLVVASDEFMSARILHKGASIEKVDVAIEAATTIFPAAYKLRGLMVEKQMSDEEMVDFARQASIFRVASDDDFRVNPASLLVAEFEEQESPTLWNVYNRVQRHLVTGGFSLIRKPNVERKQTTMARRARPITNLSRDVHINEQLWELALSYVA